MTRPSWDDYWSEMAALVATRATCPMRSVGAVLVKDNRILSTGYNGAASGEPHCTDAGCLPDADGACLRVVHAEVNAIIFALGGTAGATLYTTCRPCVRCAVLLMAAGVTDIRTAPAAASRGRDSGPEDDRQSADSCPVQPRSAMEGARGESVDPRQRVRGSGGVR